MKHKCPRETCGHVWDARVRKPKQCPRCKFYLPLANLQAKQKEKDKNEIRE